MKKSPPTIGRPKRRRILAETAAAMRRKDATLRKIHRYLNASGVKLKDPRTWQPEHPYYQAARLWADSGKATLKQFKESEGRELEDLALHRYLEACDLLEKIAAGEVPLIDADGRVVPMKGETQEEADARATSATSSDSR